MRILVVEDEVGVRETVCALLKSENYAVDAVGTAEDGIFMLKENEYDGVVLDLMLPDTSGETVCQELKEMGDFPIIMLTSKSSEEERVAGFALGADDYVVKPFSPRELVYRVKAVLKRAQKGDLTAAEPMNFNGGLLVIDGHTYTVKKKGLLLNLTPTEFKVLYTIASHSGKVFTREELVEKALGYQFEGYERSIDAHIKNIRHKIEDDSKNPSLILTIYGVGYRFSGKRDA